MKTRILAVICVLASIAGIFFLSFGVKEYNQKQNEKSAYFEKYDTEMRELEYKKKQLEEEINELNKKVETGNIVATVCLIMCDMNEDIYSVIFPLTEQYGIKCTLVLTGDRLPDNEGTLTSAQIAELITAGWKIIPGWVDGDGANGITVSSAWIINNGYNHDNTVYINSADATAERCALLSAEGFSNIIIDNGEGTVDNISTDTITDVWYPSAIGYNSNRPKNILNETIDLKGNLIFKLGAYEQNEVFDEKLFPSMISYLSECQTNGQISILDIPSARNYTVETQKSILEMENAILVEKTALEEKIAEIDAEIASLYPKYKN